MQKAACLLMMIAGCGGAVAPEAGRSLSEIELACSGVSSESVQVLRMAAQSDWLAGFTLDDEITTLALSCATTPTSGSCFGCGSAIVRDVYALLGPPTEREPLPPPMFVSGNVFSFLTPVETDVFLSRVAILNDDIERAIAAELGATTIDLGNRGFSGGLLSNAQCQALLDETRAKREGTWAVLQEMADTFVGFNLEATFFREITDFNCREYPNFSRDLGEGRGSLIYTCVLDFPC